MSSRNSVENPARHLSYGLYHSPLNDKGVVLVIVLLITTLLTALVIQFAYGIFLTTSALRNWQDSQRLSIAAASSITHLKKWLVSPEAAEFRNKPSLEMEIPLKMGGREGRERLDRIFVYIQDESAKFNLNTLVSPAGNRNEKAFQVFVRLLGSLNLDTDLADTIVDWIDPDQISSSTRGETGAKNEYLVKPDELLFIPGIDREVYSKLLSYVTIWGNRELIQINLNTAPKEILMSLREDVTAELADRILAYRENAPFGTAYELSKVAGFENDYDIQSFFATNAMVYFVRLTGECDGVKRIIETAEAVGPGNTLVTKYWKEY